ncbi:hypothetical protein Pta02_30980 [Planobispora takensis]|uniref:Uncharacterized protein n=1 Tax=Planobispora takensis TaxID=1367882 RepID=A0A8J3WTA7_9ACTN|nr:hypothetical protein Pta02_30980 [Planobispora takensis]
MIKAVSRLSDRLLAQVLPEENASAACGGWRVCGCVWSDSYRRYVRLVMRYDTDRGNSCTNCYVSGYC